MRLVPDQFSTSTLCFTVYVSLASIGIDIFEFDCHSRRIEVLKSRMVLALCSLETFMFQPFLFVVQRKGFISAQGLLLTDIIHSVIRPSTLADLREENSAQPSAPYGAIEIKTNAFSSSIVDASSGEDEIKFKGSLLCIDRYKCSEYKLRNLTPYLTPCLCFLQTHSANSSIRLPAEVGCPRRGTAQHYRSSCSSRSTLRAPGSQCREVFLRGSYVSHEF